MISSKIINTILQYPLLKVSINKGGFPDTLCLTLEDETDERMTTYRLVNILPNESTEDKIIELIREYCDEVFR